jgi:hypothetical protein
MTAKRRDTFAPVRAERAVTGGVIQKEHSLAKARHVPGQQLGIGAARRALEIPLV